MNIIDKPSPNFYAGRGKYKPEAIVIHIMEGTLSGTDAWFANPQSKVSAHYGVGTNGEIHRYVQETNTAWHAGRVNAPGWKLIKPGINGQFINPNFYTVGIEHEGNINTEWTEGMYRASSDLIAAIATRWSIPLDRDHVIGHHEIYSIKTCPGNKVDLSKLIALASQPGPKPILNYPKIMAQGQALASNPLNIRPLPNTSLPPIYVVPKGTAVPYEGYTDEGEIVNGNGTWFVNSKSEWFWSGGVIHS